MITFISGRAASGKTFEVYNRIKNLAQQKENVILIVPEQFSFESEKAMLGLLGEEDVSYVSVLPFSRIYDTIGRITGGICGKVLTTADKYILMNRAISTVADEMLLWGKYSNSASFAGEMIKSIDEFKFCAINADDLRRAADNIEDLKLKSKLKDTALVYDTYEALLGTSFIDPADYMDKLYDMLLKCDYFADKSVFFDGFKSFSGQQFKVIDRIVATANNVTFTFIDDLVDKRPFSLLTNVRKTKNHIERIINSHNLTVSENIFLDRDNYNNYDLKVLENSIFTGAFSDDTEKKSITVCAAESIYDETEFTARTIRKLIKEEDAQFSDFVIIARDTETYEDALSVACKRNNVNVFIDKKTPLSVMPISSLVVSAIEFTKKPTVKTILDFYKSGIAGMNSQDVSLLEKYTYIWKIKAQDFEKRWDMNPNGFTDKVSDDFEQELENINVLRAKAIMPLVKFKSNFDGTPKQRIKAIFDLLEDISARQSLLDLTEFYKASGDFEYADLIKQSYSQFISLLDNIVQCFPDTYISKPMFFDALKTILSFNSVGVVPQTLDEAVFGSADRIRPARPKYAFILGVNQGIFPRINTLSGIFTNSDILKLKVSGLEINDRTLDFAVDEQLLFYSNVCCATNKVFISYSKFLPDNSVGLPSRFISQIQKLNVINVNEPDVLSVNNLPQTLKSTEIEYYTRKKDAADEAKTLLEALKNPDGSLPDFIKDYSISAENAKLSGDLAKKLYGNEIFLSATKLETYSSCKFKYFCRFVAKADKYIPAEINPLQRGNIVHYVLQQIVETYKSDIVNLSPDEINNSVDKYCRQYLDSIPGYNSYENERIKYLIFTVSRTLKEIVSRLAAEFSQSEFKPVGCEVKIGKNSPIKVDFTIDDNCRVVLTGSVDRIDCFGDNVRIIDYKTGTKKFYFPEILDGLNMQMLIYLYAVNNSGLYGSKPAGILYSFAARNKRGKSVSEGLIVGDASIVYAMEEANKGEFVPKYNEKKLSGSYISAEDYSVVLEYVNEKLKEVGREILSGDVSAVPIVSKDTKVCDYCEFSSVCRINKDIKKDVMKISNDEVIEIIKGGESSGK